MVSSNPITTMCRRRPDHLDIQDGIYIRTHEGWLYLSAVIDLFSRQVIGWSMGHRIDTEIVLNALLMALWRRHPKLLTPSTLIRAVSSLGMHGKTSCALTTWFPA